MKKREDILAATVLRFEITGKMKLCRSRVDGAYKVTRRLRRQRNRKHAVVFHFMGRQAQIRACQRWIISAIPVPDGERDDGVVQHHFVCRPTDQTVTANAWKLRNGVVHFMRDIRRNTGPVNLGTSERCTRPIAA